MEELIGGLIIIGFIIGFIYLILLGVGLLLGWIYGIFIWVASMGLYYMPVWLGSILIMKIIEYFIKHNIIKLILTKKDISQFLAVNISNDKINYHVDENDDFEEIIEDKKWMTVIPSFIATIFSFITIPIVLQYIDENYGGDHFMFIGGSIISLLAIVIINNKIASNFRNSIASKVSIKIKEKFQSVSADCEQLLRIESEILNVAEIMELNNYAVFHKENLSLFLRKNITDILQDKSLIKKQIDKERKNAEYEYAKLVASKNQYETILQKHKKMSNLVSRTGSRTLIIEADDLHKLLYSENILILLKDKRWDEFNDFLSKVEQSIVSLINSAQGFSGETSSNNNTYQNNNFTTEEHKAFATLGLLKTATLEEVNKRFRELSKKYHPDTGNGDIEKQKEINEARAILRKRLKK